ncbi:MAG: M23 family metallopeptidase [Candidatus Cloacimonadota bacterium]|nr:MAG: M23 family metallopeptidase [Candidatus Cloacimonadota bacterium]
MQDEEGKDNGTNKPMKRFPQNYLFLLFFVFLAQVEMDGQYIWPLDGEKHLNSNFAECRPNHFHGGIDLHAKEGTPLKAIGDGYIWHVSVNPFGYGKSLFLKLNDGKIIVYAHLSRFDEKVDNIVALEQKRRFAYRVSLYFDKKRLPVSKGDIVGYTGSTGAMGAHLHFEMRDAANRPINPLTHGYSVIDTTPPVIKGVQLTPLDDRSTVGGTPFPVIIRPRRKENYYTSDDTISIQGRIGVEILCEDYQNKWSFRLNIAEMEMYVNGERTFHACYDRFSYAHTREVELEFNYDLYNKGLGRFHRLYVYGNNHLSYYRERNGLLVSTKLKKVSEIKIVCYDANKNSAVLILFVRKIGSKTNKEMLAFQSSYLQGIGLSFYKNIVGVVVRDKEKVKIKRMRNIMPIGNGFVQSGNVTIGYFKLIPGGVATCSLVVESSQGGGEFVFDYTVVSMNNKGAIVSSNKEFMVTVDKGQLYEDLYARCYYVKEDISEGLVLKKGPYMVEPLGTIFRKEVTVLFQYPSTSSKKIGIYKKLKKGWLYLGNEYDGEKKAMIATSRHLGTFALLEDTIAPEISDFQIVKNGNRIKKLFFIVKDTGTGFKISDIHISLDGVAHIPVFHPYRDEVSFLLFNKTLNEGGHTAKIRVKDRAGNKSSLSVSF